MDVFEKIQQGYYKTKLTYTPLISKDNLKRNIEKEIENTFVGTAVEFRSEVLRIAEDRMSAIKENQRLRREDEARLLNEFKQDLFKHEGVENNNKREKCYSIAWDNGHSYGLIQVACDFSELVELIK